VTNRLNFSNFDSSSEKIRPGTLLVASPALFNTPFRKSVVLIVQNNDEGTFGVVLNRPANEQIQVAWQKLIGTDSNNPNLVHGGPIGGPVFAIHQQEPLAELTMPSGICITLQSEMFKQIIDESNAINLNSIDETDLNSYDETGPIQFDSNDHLHKGNSTNYRIVFGIAGWQDDQLLNEINEGLWFTLDGNPERVFDKPEFMWEKSLRRYSRQMLRNVLGIDQIPLDPLLN